MSQSVLELPRIRRQKRFSRSTFFRLAALTPTVLVIHGYHPFADDAGIYIAGIRKLLNPALYRLDAPFVVANTRLSIFAHVLAEFVRFTHLPLTIVLLAAYLVSIFLFLLGSWLVASRLFSSSLQQWFAVLLAGACFTLPVAGTALVLMDPYVTARSFSTPLGLFAVAAVLERRWRLAALFLVFTILMHPLMGLYTTAFVILYAVADSEHPSTAILLGGAGIAVVGFVAAATRHLPISRAYYEAIHTHLRTFLFPWSWTWYEDMGLILPMALLVVAMIRSDHRSRVYKLCYTCVVLGLSATIASFLFVHASGPYFVARIQILRSFHIVYLIGVLLLGGWLGATLTSRPSARWVAAALPAIAALGLFAAQRATYPLCAHIELPGMSPCNPWAREDNWIRNNTSLNAVFAANPDLVSLPVVDAHGFRAATERSILADNKDEGVAAIVDPSTAAEWAAQSNAEAGIDNMPDAERIRRLKPFGVTWLLLPADSATRFACPYRNNLTKVCALGS